VRLVEEGLAPRDDTRAGGKTKTVFYAKAGRRDARAVLDLELVPVAANSPTFTLLLHGQPLAKLSRLFTRAPLVVGVVSRADPNARKPANRSGSRY
jgi:hypothetical protein